MLKKTILSDATGREGLKVVYDDVAPYAKEHSTPQTIDIGLLPGIDLFPGSDVYPYSTTIGQVLKDLKRDDLIYPGYALCLPGFSLLNGDYTNFPDTPDDYGYISDEVSDKNGRFFYTRTESTLLPGEDVYPSILLLPAQPHNTQVDSPCLSVSFDEKFTSVGILLTFNSMSKDYASHLNIKWYADDELLSNMDFHPDDTKFFCSNYVKLYDRLIITFYETSKPFRPVFLTRIDYGIYRDFLDDEIKTINCQQEINAISENISINTMNLTVRAKSSVPFDLQKKQKLSLYFNGNLLGNFYLKNGSKKSKTDYYLDSHDALGILDGNEFPGGIFTGQKVPDIIDRIFADEDFNYLLDESFDQISLYGYIPYTTKRNALVQVAFAIGAVVDTSNYDGVIIYPVPKEQTGIFNDDEIFDGLTLEHTDVVTGIRMTMHTYQPSDELEELYNDTLSGTVEVVFSDPHHDLAISGGEIKKSGDNFAVIAGTGATVILSGKKYNHYTTTTLKENPNIAFNKNVKEVVDATLVNPQNGPQVLKRIYDYYQRAESVVCDVLLGGKVLGEIVGIDTGYDGPRTGTIERIDYDFTEEIKAEVRIHE